MSANTSGKEGEAPPQTFMSIVAGVRDRGFAASGFKPASVARVCSAAARPTEAAAVGRGRMAP